MHVTLVHVRVKQAHIDDFIAACEKNHLASVTEPGNCRFDILQAVDDPCHFILYEAYRSPQDAAAHKDTAHYRIWRETVASWMAEPRQGVSFKGLFPQGGGQS